MNRSGSLGTVIALAALSAACEPPEVAGFRPTPPGQPIGWDADVRLPRAVNVSPDPGVVEIDLEARVASVELLPGTRTDAWTYGGSVPGPLIRVKRGQRLIVHFRNDLPEETTIHWHGVRVPLGMDGVPDLSQPAVPPGGSFDYDFVVPDAGLFWYHPHVQSAVQLGDGLYGALLVEDDPEPKALGDELVLVLSDVDLDDKGRVQPADVGGDLGTLFGREGNVILVNGKVNPVIRARPGLPQRWRIVNAAKTRYFQLGLAGHSFLRIGGDGGFVATPVTEPTVVLTPAQRADVVVVPTGEPGTELPLRWIAYDRGFGSTFNRPDENIATVRFEGSPVESLPVQPPGRVIAALDPAGATLVDLALTSDQVDGHLVLGINGEAFTAEVHAHVGETQVWTLTSAIVFAHPFHLHGFFFQVLDINGAPPSTLEWRDTIHVPASGSARLVVRFEDRPGTWMFHCHILDHADAGMMGMVMLHP